MAGGQVVLLDTNVFSALFVTPEASARKQGHPVDAWRSALQGQRIAVSFQTRAEALVGAHTAKWGERRVADLVGQLNATPTVELDASVSDAYVELTVAARSSGLGIAHKIHVADRWIAACAIAKSVPLLSGDKIFDGAPKLELIQLPA